MVWTGGLGSILDTREVRMIDLNKLKELVALMAANDLAEVAIRQGDDHVTIKRGGAVAYAPVAQAMPVQQAMPVAQANAAAANTAPAPAPAAVGGAGPGIESPMVGTFYAAPNPDAPPFVKVGQTVTPDTVVCIIEAMKVFNEIKAEKAGVVESVLVKSGQAVEFGQRLFGLK
jgi:acetyl-CoA carboxylase biotin carboxyl carrier protein